MHLKSTLFPPRVPLPTLNAPTPREPAMNTYSTYRALTPLQFATVMDTAKRRATQARSEAIDGFWGAVAQHVRSAWRALARGVQRQGRKAVTTP
jgi:hypothetical protein